MPRDGSGIYHRPAGTDAVTDTTIESTKYNAFVADVEQDLNTPRPIVAGGTGASSAAGAMANFGGELAKQVVTNYDSNVFVAGSFYSAAGATSAPVAGHAFSGICYVSDASNMFIEARDQDDTTQPGDKWTRQLKAGVWSAWSSAATAASGRAVYISDTAPVGAPPNSFWWKSDTGILYVRYADPDSTQWVMATPLPDTSIYLARAGGTMTGMLTLNGNPVAALDAAPKQYVDAQITALPGTANPLMDGAVSVGAATKFAREDHRHPTDTTLLPIAGGTISGNLVVNGTFQVNSTATLAGSAAINGCTVYNGNLAVYGNGGNNNRGHINLNSATTCYIDWDSSTLNYAAGPDHIWYTSGVGNMHLQNSELYLGGNLHPGSDARWKKNVEALQANGDVDQLRVVSFNWIDEDRPQGTQFGLIAQEVQKVIPELVTEMDGRLHLNLVSLVAKMLVEQQALKKRVAELEAR